MPAVADLHIHDPMHVLAGDRGAPLERMVRVRGRTKTLEESLEVIARHVDRIAEITGSHRHVAIGSDFDGFIKPTLGGLESASDLASLADALVARYGEGDAEQILSGNALRVLRTALR